MKGIFTSLLLLFCISFSSLYAQFNPLGGDNPLQLDGQRGFLIMTAGGLASFFASTFSSFRTEDYLYTQHGWYTDGFTETDKQIFFHGVGLEKRLAHWFGVGVELQIQHIYGSDYANLGGGLMTSYRWLAFGKKQLSPYFEYGAGIFNGIREFPEEGTRFTFRLVYKIGLELTTERGNKIRVAYGHIHQSNNDLFDVNPGYDGNGISLSYSALLDR